MFPFSKEAKHPKKINSKQWKYFDRQQKRRRKKHEAQIIPVIKYNTSCESPAKCAQSDMFP